MNKGKTVLFFAAVMLARIACFAQTGTIEIRQVSVQANGNVAINYIFTAPSPVYNGNIKIFRSIPGTVLFGEIATLRIDLPVYFQGEFIDHDANTGEHQAAYYIVVLDETGTTVATSAVHRTIFLTIPTIDLCLKNINLSWVNYTVTTSVGEPVYLPAPFDSVRVLFSDDGINYSILNTLLQQPTGTGLQAYPIRQLTPGTFYFRIQASGQGIVSNSNIRIIDFFPPVLHDLKILYVDVIENDKIKLNFNASGDTGEFIYHVYRSSENDAQFERVGSLPLPGVFTDTPDVLRGPWFYRIEAYFKTGGCPDRAFATHDFSSLFLKVRPGNRPRQVVFEWEHYFPPERRFTYQLERKTNEGHWLVVPGFFDSGLRYFSHFVLPEGAGIPSVFRMVAADIDNPLLNLTSNVIIMQEEPTVFIPNAFRPTSQHAENQVFKPLFFGFTPSNFLLVIFNRWGQQVFSTSDPAEGWDGRTADGQFAGVGVFSFVLRYDGPDGITRQKQGVVALIE
ncbi:MAG TPA: gliding motility-associated C-terminal domain-containing protein [Bacteroidales bacterium]|nr:gliding motility-associated C-terminal domain-containing protein [Bacteroidales bacterium]